MPAALQRNLPGLLLIAGVLLQQLSFESKQFFPDSLGRSFPLQWGSSLAATIFFTLGFFIALRYFFAGYRWASLGLAVLNLSLILSYLCLYVGAYMAFSRLLAMPNATDAILPKIVESEDRATSEKARWQLARDAYVIDGVKLPYRKDDGSYAEFVPSADDVKFLKKSRLANMNINQGREILEGQLWQYPYLFGLNLGAFLLTLIVALVWVAFTKEPLIAST